MTDQPLRILIVDDHPVVRAGLRAIITGEPDLTVVGESGDGNDAVRLAAALRPQVVLMDLRLANNTDGIEATREIMARVPDTNVVVLTTHDNSTEMVRALAAGARGYVLKAGPPEELLTAIRAVPEGGTALSPQAAALLVNQVVHPAPILSNREIEVVRLVAEGLGNREIARTLFLSEATVKTHLVRIYHKLGVENRAGAVSAAVQRSLIRLD